MYVSQLSFENGRVGAIWKHFVFVVYSVIFLIRVWTKSILSQITLDFCYDFPFVCFYSNWFSIYWECILLIFFCSKSSNEFFSHTFIFTSDHIDEQSPTDLLQVSTVTSITQNSHSCTTTKKGRYVAERAHEFPVFRNLVFCSYQILSFHTLSFYKFSYLHLLYVPVFHIAPKSHKQKSWIQLKTDSFWKKSFFLFFGSIYIFSMPYIWNKNRHSQSFLHFVYTFALLFTTLLNSLNLNNKNSIFTRLGKLR